MDNAKSKIAAGLLAIFLGGLGIHNFYLGYNNKGLLQLLLTIGSIVLGTCTSFLFVGFVFYFVPCGIAIWGFIEGIMILTGGISTDANGVPLKE